MTDGPQANVNQRTARTVPVLVIHNGLAPGLAHSRAEAEQSRPTPLVLRLVERWSRHHLARHGRHRYDPAQQGRPVSYAAQQNHRMRRSCSQRLYPDCPSRCHRIQENRRS